MSRKVRFAADRISKSFLPKSDPSSTSSDSDSPEPDPTDLSFIPSRLRDDAVPAPDGRQVSRTDLNSSDLSEEDEEEESFDSDTTVPAPPEMESLEAELAALEAGEGASLVDSLREQQEADLKVAVGTSALRSQYSALLLLRLKFQGLLIGSNVLPPAGVAFEAAVEDPEVAGLLEEVRGGFEQLGEELHEMKEEIQQMYGWEVGNPGDQMMGIIRHWGARLRMGSAVKKGTVINRSVEEQIAGALENLGELVQPSRHRDPGDQIFGMEEQPEVLPGYYNDYAWYKKLLADFMGEKTPEAKVVVERSKKKMLRGKQINYQVIPKLQGFMIPSRAVGVMGDIDALYNSLMK
jgi:hypothetical protein